MTTCYSCYSECVDVACHSAFHYCFPCLKRYVQYELGYIILEESDYDSLEVKDITSRTCNAHCSSVQINKLMSRTVFNKSRIDFSVLQRKLRCTDCPRIDCFGSVINNECQICYTQVCHRCLSEKHPGFKCDPDKIEEIKQTILSTIEEYGFCNVCKVPFQKMGGCDLIICRRCGYEFQMKYKLESKHNMRTYLNTYNDRISSKWARKRSEQKQYYSRINKNKLIRDRQASYKKMKRLAKQLEWGLLK